MNPVLANPDVPDDKKAHVIMVKEFGGSRNFITPAVIRYGLKGNLAYELSRSNDRMPDMAPWGDLYGVTVVIYDPETDTTERSFDLSDCFQSRAAAEQHIENLPTK